MQTTMSHSVSQQCQTTG